MRKRGISIVVIERKLDVNRSTLSGWFHDIKLTKKQKRKLENAKMRGLIKARSKAILWQREQKRKRIEKASLEAEKVLKNFNLNNNKTLELLLSMLYLGEGLKKNEEAGLGNSDPLIVQTFLKLIKRIYKINSDKLRYQIFARADQNPSSLKKFWSDKLHISKESFSVYLDKRTVNSKTYPGYHGVCLVRNGPVHFKRRILSVGRMLLEKIVNGRD